MEVDDSRRAANGRVLIEEQPEPPGSTLDRCEAARTTSALREATRAVDLLLRRDGPRPTTLGVRAGDVSIELSWAPPAPPAGATPTPVEHPAAPPACVPAEAPDPDAGPPADLRQPTPPVVHITAPAVGTFYRAPSPGMEPFVQRHSTVVAGQQVAIVEAMKMMIPVHAGTAGRVGKVLRGDGDMVEYNEPLFELEPL
jgi:acetyl-CoA carboxylase biotin carboxyl carrier protein